jgi:hypothetical protein
VTDLEISKALALAIGHHKFDVRVNALTGNLMVLNKANDIYTWQRFDYRDWNVIGPIAERYDCFPITVGGSAWEAVSRQKYAIRFIEADTPQKAIALAVIAGAKI